MNKCKTYNVGLYIRLSREDGDNMESESISNQRDFLNMYLERTTEKLYYIDEYIDDGFTGSNFDRPSWKRLLADIDNGKVNYTSFEGTKEFTWMKNNAYKYGFILRFPKGKEKETGYEYESWHYRYVGVDIAKEIKDKNVSLEEYHATNSLK